MSTLPDTDCVQVATVKSVHPTRRELTLDVEVAYLDRVSWVDVEWLYLCASPQDRVKKHRVLDWKGTDTAPIATLGPGTPQDMMANLKGCQVLVEEEELAETGPGELLEVKQLLGCKLVTEAGEVLGKVVQVFSTAHNAALQVEDPAGNYFSIPLIEEVALAMNLENAEITVGDLAPYRVDDED